MKTILITGTSSGIGRATAKYFAEKGWNVVATMRTPERETEFIQLPNIIVTKLDVENMGSIKESIAKGIEHFRKIDVLINNAGITSMGIFEGLTDERIQKVFKVNVFGLMNTTKAILPHFRDNKEGTIVNISSVGGIIPMPLMSLYNATKFGIEGFTESLSYELSSQNIKVKLVEPGAVKTNFGRRPMDFHFNESLTDYNQFMGKVRGELGKMAGPEMTTADTAAKAIYQIVNDQSSQLRYVIGEDANRLIGMREELGDERFFQSMKKRYS